MSSQDELEYVNILDSRYTAVEESINNTVDMLLTFVTDCKSLQNQIETVFQLFETKLRERKHLMLNQLNMHHDQHSEILKQHMNTLQSKKQCIIKAQKQQKSVIFDQNINSSQKYIRLQQITDNTIKHTNINPIQQSINEFIVDSATVCNIISNIGTLQQNDDDNQSQDDIKNEDIITFGEEIQQQFDMNEIKQLFKPILLNNEYENDADDYDEKEAVWNEVTFALNNNDYECLKYWTISKVEEMNKFKTCENFEIMTGPIIQIKDMIFECTIAPNGNTTAANGYVALGVRINSFPKNISEIVSYIMLFCKNSNYCFKTSKVFRKIDDFQFWGSKSLSLDACNHLSSITFGCFIEIIHIKYINDKFYIPKPIQMDMIHKYKWNISKYLLNKFQNANKYKVFYSPNFNYNCFCIICSPKGNKTYDNTLLLKLKLLKLPYGINAIKCNIKLNSNFENIQKEQTEILRYSNVRCLIACINVDVTTDNNWKQLESLEVNICIEIISIFDNNGETINKESWKKFGIS